MAEPFRIDWQVKRYGCSPGDTATTGVAAGLFREGFVDSNFGIGLGTVRLTLLLRHGGPPPKPFNRADVARWHAHLANFPKVKIEPKAKRASVEWATSVDTKLVGPDLPPTVARVDAIFVEVERALEALRPRLARVKAFDSAAFLAQARHTMAATPRTERPLMALAKRAWAAQNERLAQQQAARDPWDALNIDWKKQHPEARRLLPDPFFWDSVDDFAPHGSDTGADVLERYKTWRSRHLKDLSGATAYVERILHEWGMANDDTQAAKDIRDEAFVALAVGQIMLDGRASADATARALTALARQEKSRKASADPQTRLKAVRKVRAVLVGR